MLVEIIQWKRYLVNNKESILDILKNWRKKLQGSHFEKRLDLIEIEINNY
jgi:hypothetical protein